MSNKSERKRLARRRAISGYPLDIIFTTPSELESYFSEEKITCLECGKKYRQLGGHLLIHDMTAEDYKDKHGIPWGMGLTGSDTKALKIAAGKMNIANGVVKPFTNDDRLLINGSTRRKRQPVQDVLSMNNINKINYGKSGEETARRKLRSERILVDGRMNLGDLHPFAKLNGSEVSELKSLAESRQLRQIDIAKKFQVSQALVSLIKTKKVRKSQS